MVDCPKCETQMEYKGIFEPSSTMKFEKHYCPYCEFGWMVDKREKQTAFEDFI